MGFRPAIIYQPPKVHLPAPPTFMPQPSPAHSGKQGAVAPNQVQQQRALDTNCPPPMPHPQCKSKTVKPQCAQPPVYNAHGHGKAQW